MLQQKLIRLNIEYQEQDINLLVTLNYYDDSSLDVAEFDYDIETEYHFEEEDELAEAISEWLFKNFGRGWDSIPNEFNLVFINDCLLQRVYIENKIED